MRPATGGIWIASLLLVGPILLGMLIYFGFVLMSPPCAEVWDQFCGTQETLSPIQAWSTAGKANHLFYAGSLVLLPGLAAFEIFRAALRGRPMRGGARMAILILLLVWLALLVL